MFESQFMKNNLKRQPKKEVETFSDVSLNSLKREHLKDGENPILASILSAEEFCDFSEKEESRHAAVNMAKIMKGIGVDYYGEPVNLRSDGMKNPEKYSYVISDCDSQDKWSSGYKSCVGTIMAGRNKEGMNISNLSHQDFKYILNNPTQFNEDMRQSMQKFIALTEDGTRDLVIFGGKRWFPKKYVQGIKLLGEMCREEVGFDPTVISGPGYEGDYPMEAYYENDTRHLYLVRPKESENVYLHSFLASEIGKQPWYKKFRAERRL